MPAIVSANTNAVATMIGENAADLIRASVLAPVSPEPRVRRLTQTA